MECRLVITALFPVVRLPVTLVFRGRVVEVVNSIVIVHIAQVGKALVHLVTALITLVLNVSALLIVFVRTVTVVVIKQTLALMGITLIFVQALVM